MPRWALVLLLSTTLPACAWALPESAAGRRAIRGSLVETEHESEELRAMREFDEETASDRLGVKPIDAPPPAWLDNLKLPDLPVRFDARVVRYLEFYRSDRRGRAIMTSWLKKEGRWKALLEEALRRPHLPAALVYVSMIESG